MANAVISDVGLADARSKCLWPARLDWNQSASGLFVALFMWGHMFFVSSILVSEHAMWTVTKMFEGYFVFGRPYPGIVSAVVAGVTAVIVLHAALALRSRRSEGRLMCTKFISARCDVAAARFRLSRRPRRRELRALPMIHRR